MNKFLLCIFIVFTLYSKIGLSKEILIKGLFTNINELYEIIKDLNTEKEGPKDQFVFEISSELKNELKIQRNKRKDTKHTSGYIVNTENKQICLQYKKLNKNHNIYVTRMVLKKLKKHLKEINNSKVPYEKASEALPPPDFVSDSSSDTEEEDTPVEQEGSGNLNLSKNTNVKQEGSENLTKDTVISLGKRDKLSAVSYELYSIIHNENKIEKINEFNGKDLNFDKCLKYFIDGETLVVEDEKVYKIDKNGSKTLFYDLKDSNYIDMSYDAVLDRVCILTHSLAGKKVPKIFYYEGISTLKTSKDKYYCVVLTNEAEVEKKYAFTSPLLKILSCQNGKYLLLGESL